jgi:hypothetical protein
VPKVKKESEWHIGFKGEIPPYDYHVWFKGSKKPVLMYGFDEDHIRAMCKTKPDKIKRIKLKEKEIQGELLGPKGALLHGDPDYRAGFELLKEWIDSQGGPPEHLRKKIRELWIDYQKPSKKQ